MDRRSFLAGLAATLLPAAASANPVEWIVSLLWEASHDPSLCGARNAAVQGTLSRLEGVNLPEYGKVIVVNIPSGVVTAYQDGIPVIESRAVVGNPSTPTPELDTRVTFVRPNPTWTVPESIVTRKGWRAKLAEDPAYFADNGFQIMVGGQMVSAYDAAPHAREVQRFVQQPGPYNALGLLKIGLHNSNAIYLHDTNQPSNYDADLRAASAGCIRIEDVRDIAAWILGLSRHDIDAMIDADDMTDYVPGETVRVVIGYWTAWPDANGQLRFYPDIYEMDGAGEDCTQSAAGHAESRSYAPGSLWREYETR